MAYSAVKFEIIHNPKCNFYKLCRDEVCQLDEFQSMIERNTEDKKSFKKILSRMDSFDPKIKYPKEKFNHIEGRKTDRNDVYEFKEGKLRIYVILIEPNIFLIRGGWKKNQHKKDESDDIKKIFKAVNDIDLSTISL